MMNDEERFTLEDAHLRFAKQANGEVWDLLEKKDRSKSDGEQMLHAVHASLYHWLHVGTGLHQQRGEWLISRVHAVLGHGEEALRHAERCAELTEEHAELMKDFDIAYSHECLARSLALLGKAGKANELLQLAHKAGEAIGDEESRDIYFQDLNGGDWFGVK
jgi:hypothetical protein